MSVRPTEPQDQLPYGCGVVFAMRYRMHVIAGQKLEVRLLPGLLLSIPFGIFQYSNTTTTTTTAAATTTTTIINYIYF